MASPESTHRVGEQLRPTPEEYDSGCWSDDDLLRAHVGGDAQAFNEIVRRHRGALWATAMRVLGDHHDAQDAMQTALLYAFHRAHTYRADGGVLPWLRVIVENTSRTSAMARRRPGRAIVDPMEDAGARRPTVASGEDEVDHYLVLRTVLEELPVDQRRAFFLVRLRGYSMLETAELEGVALGTIKSRVARARARLVESLEVLRDGGNL